MNEAELCSSAKFDVKSLEQEKIIVERHKILYVVVRHKGMLGYRPPWRHPSFSLHFLDLQRPFALIPLARSHSSKALKG